MSMPHGVFIEFLAGAQATEALKITAPDLVKSGVMDEIIREPLGGAHADPMAAFPYIKDAILKIWHTKYAALPSETLNPENPWPPSRTSRTPASKIWHNKCAALSAFRQWQLG